MAFTPDDVRAVLSAPVAQKPKPVSAPVSRAKQMGDVFDSVREVFAGMDPAMANLGVGLLRESVQDPGLKAMLKDTPLTQAEVRTAALEQQYQDGRLERAVSRMKVEDVVGWSLVHRGDIVPGMNLPLETVVSQGPLDQSLLEDPGRMSKVLLQMQKLQAEGLIGNDVNLAIDQRTMFLSGVDSFQKSKEQRAAEGAKEQLSRRETSLKLLEGDTKGKAAGKDPADMLVRRAWKNVQEREGIDLQDTSDEPAGAAGLAAVYELAKKGAPELGAKDIADRFIGLFGRTMKDDLEEMSFVQDAEGRTIIAAQEAGWPDPVKRDAALIQLALIDQIAGESGKTRQEVFAQLGINASEIEPSSLAEGHLLRSGKRPPGFRETVEAGRKP
jgi:hypothetical protein